MSLQNVNFIESLNISGNIYVNTTLVRNLAGGAVKTFSLKTPVNKDIYLLVRSLKTTKDDIEYKAWLVPPTDIITEGTLLPLRNTDFISTNVATLELRQDSTSNGSPYLESDAVGIDIIIATGTGGNASGSPFAAVQTTPFKLPRDRYFYIEIENTGALPTDVLMSFEFSETEIRN